MGQLLQFRFHLEAFPFHQVKPRPAGVSSYFEDLPPDVCRYRHCYRQCAGHMVWEMGSLDGQAVPLSVCRNSHAAPQRAEGIAKTTEWTEVRYLYFASSGRLKTEPSHTDR